jgi:hypothetical protein
LTINAEEFATPINLTNKLHDPNSSPDVTITMDTLVSADDEQHHAIEFLRSEFSKNF